MNHALILEGWIATFVGRFHYDREFDMPLWRMAVPGAEEFSHFDILEFNRHVSGFEEVEARFAGYWVVRDSDDGKVYLCRGLQGYELLQAFAHWLQGEQLVDDPQGLITEFFSEHDSNTAQRPRPASETAA